MIKKSFFTFSVIFIFNGLFLLSDAPWFVYFPKLTLIILSVFCIALSIYLHFFYESILQILERISNFRNYLLLLTFLISFSFMVLYPIRNLNLGDGIILLEHLALEAKIFGFHLTMDEILEAMLHSFLFAKYSSVFETPMDVYRIVSTISGLCALGILGYYFHKLKMYFSSYILILSSGGIYLFHGYSENYTIITTVIWFYILFGINLIRENKFKNLKALFPICMIACTLILLHLVSGYLVFSLIFLCFHLSEKGRFIKNAFFSTILSLLILLPVFLYFTFYSDVRFDFTQTHLTNPKFYPLSKIISKTHFRDILFCIIGSSFLGFILVIYSYLFYKEQFLNLFKKPEYQFIGFVLLGFLIHGFFHYPQLGFPADWDLLAFFWSPMVFLAAFILRDLASSEDNSIIPKKEISYELIPLFVFSILIFGLNAVYLTQPDLDKINELKLSMSRVIQYSESEDSRYIKEVRPEYKKFYLKVSFFLFESSEKIISKTVNLDSTALRLVKENKSFQLELMDNISKVDHKWQKDYYARLTRYHLEYLDFLKKK